MHAKGHDVTASSGGIIPVFGKAAGFLEVNLELNL